MKIYHNSTHKALDQYGAYLEQRQASLSLLESGIVLVGSLVALGLLISAYFGV